MTGPVQCRALFSPLVCALAQKAQGLGKYFRKLKTYEDTDYFRQVISQCADYRYFHSQ